MMSGIFENLMTKMDSMIATLDKHTTTMQEFMAAHGTVGATAAPAAEKKPRATKAAAEPAGPKTTEEALVAKFEAIKGDGKDEAVMKRLKAIIAEAGFASLKELRMAPGKFDDTMTALEAYEVELAAAPATTAEDDDL